MNHSSNDSCKESKQVGQQTQNQQITSSEASINASEIEKLYLRIKEDWL